MLPLHEACSKQHCIHQRCQSLPLPLDRKLPRISNATCCLQVDIRKTWLLFSSIVLAFAFVFGKHKVCRASGFCLMFDMLEAAILSLPAKVMSLLCCSSQNLQLPAHNQHAC